KASTSFRENIGPPRTLGVATGSRASTHSASSTRITRSSSSGGGSSEWATPANSARPSSSFSASARHDAHPRRCRRTAAASVSEIAPSTWSGRTWVTSSCFTFDLQRLPQLDQGGPDAGLGGSHWDAFQLGHGVPPGEGADQFVIGCLFGHDQQPTPLAPHWMYYERAQPPVVSAEDSGVATNSGSEGPKVLQNGLSQLDVASDEEHSFGQ